MSRDAQVASILGHLRTMPELARLRVLRPADDLEEETLHAIIKAAARLSSDILAPFGKRADLEGCRLVNGRVVTPTGLGAAWEAFKEGGWPGLDAPAAYGGSGLPLVVHSACEELFNGACAAFMMLPTPTRCAVRVLDAYAEDAIKQEWLPHMIAGLWSATICLSEVDAGSDVARVRTLAEPDSEGGWRVTGEKNWISFGDQDQTERIGHMVLARTPSGMPGTRGLSLFLVPDTVDGLANGVVVRRLEEKLGLHGSPTCALGFEGARGFLIGELHRGLPQLFDMITAMRLSVASTGAGIAAASAAVALDYAAVRRQGGSQSSPPVLISRHADVQRQLLGLMARAEVARGLLLMASAFADLAEAETDGERREEAALLLGWLLPIAKDFCAEAGFVVASDAIQVLGGAGYTQEWPVERYVRDARVLTIFEGTSGIQAADLAHRRLLRDAGASYEAFSRLAAVESLEAGDSEAARRLRIVLGAFEAGSRIVSESSGAPAVVDAVAYSYLRLAALAVTSVIASRLARGDSPQLAALGDYWLSEAADAAARELAVIERRGEALKAFEVFT